MALKLWVLPRLRKILALDDEDLEQIVTYTSNLPEAERAQHLQSLLGDSPESLEFIAAFIHRQSDPLAGQVSHKADSGDEDVKAYNGKTATAPPPPPPSYAALPGPSQVTQSSSSNLRGVARYHTNDVIEAGKRRAIDEQEMQQMLQNLQFRYRIYNSEIEPEHEVDTLCYCPIHQYQQRKWSRAGVQELWARAVMYPGESFYSDNPVIFGFSSNPYQLRVGSPYGYWQAQYSWNLQIPSPKPGYHAMWIQQTIRLNAKLNREAQAKVDAKEPYQSIWEDELLPTGMENLAIGGKEPPNKDTRGTPSPKEKPGEASEKGGRHRALQTGKPASKFSSFKKAIGIKSSEDKANALRGKILAEERGRWPDDQWRQIVAGYQDKVGMTKKIDDLRARSPIQYLHLLKAGYFEPIPVAWANQASNPLKFSIEAAAGWRGITPAWRGYEDLAEERLYWVLNHREGSVGLRMKPDFISEMTMARDRMARAVEPPPLYYSANDTCHLQHTSTGYSKQVMPPPFRPFDRPEQPSDDTMILLDVSGSMDFDPVRPIYDQYLVMGYEQTTQPKNKDVAKSIVRRFTDAMANHDHRSDGYDLVTFANHAQHIGAINHRNLDLMWSNVRVGGGTRVMTGWQKVKELHFRKHSQSAVHHPIYGWQAGPDTPILRLLLLLDGEATDMDEFELDLLGLSWAHVTIFLIGAEGCPHHHRHANELDRISSVNHHVSFVDAQGNCPERFVTHELLKRHLGYDISMTEFEQVEELPAYSEYA